MTEPTERQFYLETLFARLRLRRFPLSPHDYEEARLALRAGFGWDTPASLERMLCALWAKSRGEQTVVKALLRDILDDQGIIPWNLPEPLEVAPKPPGGAEQGPSAGGPIAASAEPERELPSTIDKEIVVRPAAGGTLPRFTVEPSRLSRRHFFFEPQYPLTQRQIAQIWRRLRRPTRTGPKTEVDIGATIDRRARGGCATEAVLVPRAVNSARLLLLCDRTGSMAPFDGYVDAVTDAIEHAGRFEALQCLYFHDVPTARYDRSALSLLDPSEMLPVLDDILDQIKPVETSGAFVYTDRGLRRPMPLAAALDKHADPRTSVVVIGDAGASRGRHDVARMLDTVSFLLAVRARTANIVWLNPVPCDRWLETSAAQIARHIPMFDMTRSGMGDAVSTLRGRPTPVERPFTWSI